MEVKHNLTLFLTSPRSADIDAVQGDGVRTLVCRLMSGALPWTVPNGVTAGISYELPGSEPGYYDTLRDGTPACTIEDNVVSTVLDPVLTAQPGSVKISLILREGEKQVATFPMCLRVSGMPGLGHTDNWDPPVDGFAGKIYFGGEGGALIPLGVGHGIDIEQQEDGTLRLIAEGFDGVLERIENAAERSEEASGQAASWSEMASAAQNSAWAAVNQATHSAQDAQAAAENAGASRDTAVRAVGEAQGAAGRAEEAENQTRQALDTIAKNGDFTIPIAEMGDFAIDTTGKETEGYGIRKTSGYYIASPGDVVASSDGSKSLAVFEWSLEDKSFITKNEGWVNTYTVQNDCYIRVMVNTNQSSPDIIVKRRVIRISKLEDKPHRATADYAKKSILSKNGDFTIPIAEMGDFAIDTTGKELEGYGIRKTSGYYIVSAGDVVEASNGTASLAVFEWSLEDKSFITKNDGWVKSYIVQNDCYIRVMVNTSTYTTDVLVKRNDLLPIVRLEATPHIPTLERANAYADEQIGKLHCRNNWFFDISHRGYMEEAPESTVAAFVRAKVHGYNAVEGDVRVTSDGQLVIHHDDPMPSDSSYKISEHTLAELRTNANMGTYNGIVQQILTFEEWVKLCKRLDLFMFIERKAELTDAQIAELVTTVRNNGMSDRVAWMAMPEEAEKFRGPDPDCYLAIMWVREASTVSHLALEGKPERTFIYAISTGFTSEYVASLEAVGIGAVAWLVTYSWSMPGSTEAEIKAEIKRAIDCGVRGFCLDKWTAAELMVEDYRNYL